MEAQDILDLAAGGARRAGDLLLERFRRPATGLATKSSPTDLVSDADRDAEQLLFDHIRAARPQDAILGEEGGESAGGGELTWVLDPLDGTVNFLYGIPAWCVSVAAMDERGHLVGVVHDPLHDETFTAVRGGGARLDGSPVRVSEKGDLSTALVATGFSYDPEIRDAQAEVVRRVLPRVRDIRRAGSAALDLCSVACGRVDAFYEAWMGPWDRAAGELIAREAGAVVSDLTPPKGDEKGAVVAGPAIHDAIFELVTVPELR